MAYRQLKYWFDENLATLLADKIAVPYPSFNKEAFRKNVGASIADLELKDRVEIIADSLQKYLPDKYSQSIDILTVILGPENVKETGMFKEYYWIMPIAKFIEKYGLDHFGISMAALAEVTKRNTSEYAVRPFIEKYPDQTMKQMLQWSRDKNFHLRRLASEGGRPRLPWASKLDQFIEDPLPLFPILENLKSDKIKFVQKSVANCINDILKDNYEIAMDLLANWAKNSSVETKWIIKHALRKELKKGNPDAMKLIR